MLYYVLMYSVRAPRKKKKTGRKVFLLLLPLVLLAGLAANYLRPLPAATATPEGMTSTVGAIMLKWPSAGSAAIGAQGFGVLDSYGAVSPRPMASLAKLMTALAVVEKKPFKLGQQGETYTITQRDVELYDSYLAQGGAVAKVAVGEKITEYQMLQAILLPSANNLADTAALWTFGSMDAYLAYANNMAKRFGLKQMVLADASGMSPKSIATTRELVRLGEYVMNQPVLANIVGQKSATIPVAGTINSANSRLGYNNIIGIKTGLTDQAGGCFMFAASHKLATGENIVLIGVILGAPKLTDAFDASEPLINSAKPHFTIQRVVKAGQKVANYDTPWGSNSDVIAEDDVDLVVWKGVPLTPSIKLHQPSLARNAGDVVGSFTVRSGLNGKSTNVTLKSDLKDPPFKWRLTRID